MVYCGKASQGCQSCRTRRIKCDKLKPDCSQCLRVGKKCPGYRDQLSLMFRDESSKVIQKAHAQWGVGEGPSQESSPLAPGSGSSIANASASPSSILAHPGTTPSEAFPSPPPSQTDSLQKSQEYVARVAQVVPTIEDQAFQFYVNRYLVGHPDEPKSMEELQISCQWLWDPALKDITTAVGLASLSNLRDDAELMTAARHRYGNALRITGQLVRSTESQSIDVTSRLVVMLALFELVKGTQLSVGSVRAHVAGGAALIRSWYPMSDFVCRGIRPLLQLCYSTFISAYEAGIPLPTMFHNWVNFSRKAIGPEDIPAIDIGVLIARFMELSSYIRGHVLADGGLAAVTTLKKLIDLEAEFDAWKKALTTPWLYRTEKGAHLPPAAVFNGEHHIYYDMWVARIWNHYRWARILLNQMIMELAEQCPESSSSQASDLRTDYRLGIIGELARATVISTPSHWRHPLLDEKTPLPVDVHGGAGAGAAGLPILLFQLKIAACAPGVPLAYWDWVYGVMECIWGDMGMHQAKSLMDELLAHRLDLENGSGKGTQAKRSIPTMPAMPAMQTSQLYALPQ